MKPICLFITIAAAAGAAPLLARAPFSGAAAPQAAQTPEPPSIDEKRVIEKKLGDLSTRIQALAARKTDPALLADVDVYRKAAEYILRFPEEFATRAFVAH